MVHWAECVLGKPIGGMSLHQALRSGELLCDLINTVKPEVVPRVTRTAGANMSEMRLAAKCRENITRYLEACSFLGLKSHEIFTTADLFEEKSLEAVIANVLALGQFAGSVSEYHGPLLTYGKGKVWVEAASVVRERRETSRGSSFVSISDPEGSSELDVTGLDTEGAARAWVYAVLYPHAEQGTVDADRSFHEALQSGVLLCKLLNRISPGMIQRIKETDKAWDCIENIGNYTKACTKLGVVPTFDTPDLYENKNMRVVAQNIYSLARMARSKRFAGPLLAAPVYTMMT